MRKFLFLIGFFIAFATVSTTTTSCTRKVGCELNEEMAPQTDKRGNLSTKRGKSSLFDKKQRKRMGKG